MTVLRREDVQSRVASWDDRPYRIASSPILTIVPLIIRRLRGPRLARIIDSFAPLNARSLPCRNRRCRLERRPDRACELACDRHRNLGRRLVLFRQASEATTQSLLRLVRNRNHTTWLALAPSRECHPDPRPVLIVPCGFDQ